MNNRNPIGFMKPLGSVGSPVFLSYMKEPTYYKCIAEDDNQWTCIGPYECLTDANKSMSNEQMSIIIKNTSSMSDVQYISRELKKYSSPLVKFAIAEGEARE